MIIDQCNRAQGIYAQRSPYWRAAHAAYSTALGEIARAIADVVEAYIVVAAPAAESFLLVEELLLLTSVAATKAAVAVADAVTFASREAPSSYEKSNLDEHLIFS